MIIQISNHRLTKIRHSVEDIFPHCIENKLWVMIYSNFIGAHLGKNSKYNKLRSRALHPAGIGDRSHWGHLRHVILTTDDPARSDATRFARAAEWLRAGTFRTNFTTGVACHRSTASSVIIFPTRHAPGNAVFSLHHVGVKIRHWECTNFINKTKLD